ncbi:MAG: hypothetical protein ACJAUP_003177, partial [Cellvibrionaceae bacterium]
MDSSRICKVYVPSSASVAAQSQSRLPNEASHNGIDINAGVVEPQSSSQRSLQSRKRAAEEISAELPSTVDLFKQVPNAVFGNMTSFLNPTDLKAMRPVSKDFVSKDRQEFIDPRMKFVLQTPEDFDRLTSGESSIDKQSILSLKLTFTPTLEQMCASSQLPNLTSLNLDGCSISDAGAAALLAEGILSPSLTSLNLKGNNISALGL